VTTRPGSKDQPMPLRTDQLQALLQHYIFLLVGIEAITQEDAAADAAPTQSEADRHAVRIGAHAAMMCEHPSAIEATQATRPLLEQMVPVLGNRSLADVLEHHRRMFKANADHAESGRVH